MTNVLSRGLIALGTTLALAPVVLFVLRRRRILDHPTLRSSHSTPVPRGGGAAAAVGALAALAVTPLPATDRLGVAFVAAAFGAIGLVEDLAGIPALRRLAIQFLSAALAGGLLLADLSGPLLWRVGFALGAVLFVVSYVNAYNFMDGIDGISAAQAAGAGALWFVVGTNADSAALAAGGAIIAGAALGFAPFNVPVARMFLGDVGSYFIGAWLAAVAVLGLRSGVPPEAVLAPLALYAADTATTLARRVRRGERWYLPHRDHAYQRLGDAGWSHVQASTFVGACVTVCGALGAASLTGSLPARVAADLGIVVVLGVYLLTPGWLARDRSRVVVA